MAEEFIDNENENNSPKKGRGRPKKTNSPIANEEKELTTFKQGETVGKVREVPDVVTINALQNRWKNVFKKYSNIGYDNILEAYKNGAIMLNNPFIQNSRIKKINTAPIKLSKEELNEALANPESNEQVLRGMSYYLYYTNYVYHRLMELNRDTPKYFYYMHPMYVEKNNKDKLREDSMRIDKCLKKFNVNETFKTISSQVNIEGKSSYIVRTSYDKKNVNYLLLQKLDSNKVKLTGFGSKQRYVVSFDFSIFLQAGYSIEQYPTFFKETWDQLISNGTIIEDKRGNKKINPKANISSGHMLESLMSGGYAYWVKLPQDLVYTFYTDGSHPDVFPDPIGMFNDFESLEDYTWLQGNLISKGINSVLTATVPLVKDPKPGADMTAISVDSILGFQDLFNDLVSGNCTGFFAPFNDYKLHSIDAQPEALDVVYDRIRDLIATSGNAALLSINEKPSIASIVSARAIQEARSDYLTRQFENCLNNIINDNFDCNYTWKITLHGGIFNWRDDEKECKELVFKGCKGLLPRLLSYEDMTLEDYIGSETYIDALGIELKTEQMIQQEELQIKEIESEELIAEEEAKIGRPSLSDSQVENDNTDASKSAGTDVSETKEYELEQLQELLGDN